MLEDLIQALAPWFHQWGLLIVFFATFLESSFVLASVLPGETALLLGGFFASPAAVATASEPPLNLGTVILVAFAGAVAGDLVGYGIGRAGGRALVRRFGRFVFLPEHKLPLLSVYFGRYGGRAILLGRFAPFLRSVRTLVAGTARMPFLRFLLPDVVGALLWSAAIAGTGFVLGESWRAARRSLGAGGIVVFLLLIVLFVFTWKRLGSRLERELSDQRPVDDPLAGPSRSEPDRTS